jgi:ribosome-binding factor A
VKKIIAPTPEALRRAALQKDQEMAKKTRIVKMPVLSFLEDKK